MFALLANDTTPAACHCSVKMSGGCSVRMSAEMRRPRALDALGYECPRRPEEENKSSSVRLAILAEASRVRCAALRDGIGKAKPPERGKGRST